MTCVRILLLLSLVSTALSATSQDIKIDARMGTGSATITPNGPHMTVVLEWQDKLDRPCPPYKKLEKSYRIDLEDDKGNITTIRDGLDDKSITITSPIHDFKFLNLLFWKDFKIWVYSNCPYEHTVAKFNFDKLPGDLLPVKGLSFEPEKFGGVLTWTQSDYQSVATDILITTCRYPGGKKECSEEVALPIDWANYRIDGLTPGVSGTVFARLRKRLVGREIQTDKPTEYFSATISKTIESLPPSEEDYPPIKEISVKEVRHGFDDVDMEVSYVKPQNIPSDSKWWGVSVQIVDLFREVLLDYHETQDSTILLPRLQQRTHLYLNIRAVYEHNRDHILSNKMTKLFDTGIGALAKPEIAKLNAISATKALIVWAHDPKESWETNFTISWGENSQKEVFMSKKNYAVLDNLTPGQEYDVKITAHIDHNNKRFENISDSKQLIMLPEDALKPKPTPGEILKDGLVLNWDVRMPNDPMACRFRVDICPKNQNNQCLHQRSIKSELRSVSVKFFPFEEQSITMSTECHYYPDVAVQETSDPIDVFGAFKPSAVKDLEVRSLNETSLQITFGQEADETHYVEGYQIEWAPQGDSSTQKKKTDQRSITLGNLNPATAYIVNVAPYTSEKNKGLIGEVSQATVLTQLPVPNKVTNLQAKQNPASFKVTITWNKPDYAYGKLIYEVEMACSSWTGRNTTEATSFEATVIAKHNDKCSFKVRALTEVDHQPRKTGEWETTTAPIDGLDAPVMIRMVDCAVKYKYKLEIVAPESAKSVEIFYQLAEMSKPYTIKSNSNVIAFVSHQRATSINVKGRICHQDLCSADATFNFMTNSGSPGAIEHMQINTTDDTNISLEWKTPSRTLGPIDGYVIDIRDKETNQVSHIEKTGAEFSHLFKSDRQHVDYEIKYFAFNNDHCNPGKFSGPVTVKEHSTSGKQSPPPKIVHIGDVGAKHGFYWDPPADPTIKTYHIVGTPLPREEHVKPVKEIKPVDTWSAEPRLDFSLFDPYAKYIVEISSCSVSKKVDTCGRSFHKEIETEAGPPSMPTAQFVEGGPTTIKLRWTPPVDPAGPINGYNVAYMNRLEGENPTNWEEVDAESPFTELTNLTEATEYVIQVEAFNLDYNGKKLRSPVSTLHASTQGNLASTSTIILIVAIVVVSASVIGAVVYRKYKGQRSLDSNGLINSMESVDLREPSTSNAN